MGSRVLRCGACGREVEVEGHDPQRVYRCQRCSGILLLPGVTTRRRVPPGTRFGRHQLINIAARGARSVVFRALDTEKLRLVALKQMNADAFADAAEASLWVERARRLMELGHPALVRIFEAGIEDGTPYLTMSLVEGAPLSELLRGEGLALFPTLGALKDLCRGVAHLHEKGYAHGRVTGDHALLSDDGRATLVSLDAAVPGGDPRADLQAAGRLLYEMVVRHPASDARPPRELGVELQADLEHLVMKAVRTEYPAAADLAADIDRYLSGRPLQRAPLPRRNPGEGPSTG